MPRSTFKFYLLLLKELCLFPLLYIKNAFLNYISSDSDVSIKRTRREVDNNKILVNIHEWGGYDATRKKKIKNIEEFTCGLKYQLQRFSNASYKHETEVNITMSDPDLCNNIDEISAKVDHMYFVSNEGMDFSGYAYFYDKIKDQPNSYVILTNSSVNANQSEFLDSYIEYMENNPDIGILGISFCTKIYQTFIKNNFEPHVQSFFLLTTTHVLSEIIAFNQGFPGNGITNKQLLIREGEVKMSKITKQLGYNLAIVLQDGSTYKFGRASKWDNAYNSWKLTRGDVRLFLKEPNKIVPITN